MVIVLMGEAGSQTTAVGARLAECVRWNVIEADAPHAASDLHAVVARALARREPLVLVCEKLTASQRIQTAGGLHPVRFVSLGTAREPGSDVALVLNDAADVEVTVGRLRLEFGL